MPTITKLYHRGHAAAEPRLTAVFRISFSIGTEDCKHALVGQVDDFLPRVPGAPVGQVPVEALPLEVCLGEVTLDVLVQISSPAGRGNGLPHAGEEAQNFGLQYGSDYRGFAGGPDAPGSEHWHVEQNMKLPNLPCDGGPLFSGTISVCKGRAAAAAYEILFSAQILSCGQVAAQDVSLRVGPHGARLPPLPPTPVPIQEVRPGQKPPWNPKEPTPGQLVGPDGQLVPP